MSYLYGIWNDNSHIFQLNGKQIIGRPSSKFTPDIAVPISTVSRKHGEFITDGNVCQYRDLGSSNGTYHNGKLLPPNELCILKDGDTLIIHAIQDANHLSDICLKFCVQNIPAQNVAVQKAPVRNVPVQNVAVQKTPVRNVPVQKTSDRNVLSINIEERSVSHHFQKLMLLKDIRLTIPNYSMVLILGGSGAGKTTFMNAVMGYEKAQGTILYNNINIYTEYEQMKHRIGYVPQQDLLRMNDTVYDTLLGAAQMRLSSLSDNEHRVRVAQTLQMLGLEREHNSLVGKLSGGQRKRLSIAVEYIGNPSLFFLDEPDSGLDGIMARELMENLRRIADDGRIVMVISHSPDRAFELFDRVIVLAKDSRDNCGHLVYEGDPNNACRFFGVQNLEGIVKKINRSDEGGEGLAEYFIQKYNETRGQR